MLTRRSLLVAASLLPLRAWAAAAPSRRLILVWLNGGPSQLDTFDVRAGGVFKPLVTRTPGLTLSEHLPRLAESSDLFSVVRSMTSKEGNHQRARYYLHTGYVPNATVVHPSLGAWLSHELGSDSALPAYVSLRGPGEGAGFFGAQHGPFVVKKVEKQPPNMRTTDADRLKRRFEMMKREDEAFFTKVGEPLIKERSAIFGQAVAMTTSADTAAFRLDEEGKGAHRDAYGAHDFGQACLLARRLVERGVRCVDVELDGWDTHENNFERVKELSAQLDDGLGALLRDLKARDKLKDTTVVCMGEFGRTPKINAREGRDHYPDQFFALLAGGGVRGSTVYDAKPVSVPDLFATVVTALGLSPQRARQSPLGRPIAISDYGAPVRDILVQ